LRPTDGNRDITWKKWNVQVFPRVLFTTDPEIGRNLKTRENRLCQGLSIETGPSVLIIATEEG